MLNATRKERFLAGVYEFLDQSQWRREGARFLYLGNVYPDFKLYIVFDFLRSSDGLLVDAFYIVEWHEYADAMQKFELETTGKRLPRWGLSAVTETLGGLVIHFDGVHALENLGIGQSVVIDRDSESTYLAATEFAHAIETYIPKFSPYIESPQSLLEYMRDRPKFLWVRRTLLITLLLIRAEGVDSAKCYLKSNPEGNKTKFRADIAAWLVRDRLG